MLTSTPDRVSLFRRFAAILYDSFLLLAIWLLIGLVFVWIEGFLDTPLRLLQFFLNVLAGWAFFTWFWIRSGQTLGMQTWNIRLRDDSGEAPTPWQTHLRYLTALAQWLLILLGIYLAREYGPFATILVTALLLMSIGLSQWHPQRIMLHDWLSGTRLEYHFRLSSNETHTHPD